MEPSTGYDRAVDIPAAIAALPRFGLLEGPSPLSRLPRFSAALGGAADVWIKREDLLPLAFGGNKLRNL
jgi:1-aminocyclopropane-1-carboxylate deaminase/D-cysteine desulfhydrase-like pyridoxal-dependent ACC family enzyme